MKIKAILLMIGMVLVFATPTIAATVTINHGGTQLSGTLSNLTVDANGNVTLSVSSGNLCGSSGGGTTCSNTAPTISVSNPPGTATVGTAVSATFTANANDTGQSVTVSANYGSISGSTWSWTPSSSGTNTVTLTANDGQNCNNAASYSWNVTASSASSGGGGGTSDCTDMGPQSPSYLDYINVPAGGVVYYCKTLSEHINNLVVTMSARNVSTNMANAHIFVSDTNNPTLSQVSAIAQEVSSTYQTTKRSGPPPWYNFGGQSNERLYLVRSFASGSTFYVTIYNPDSSNSTVQLYWNAY